VQRFILIHGSAPMYLVCGYQASSAQNLCALAETTPRRERRLPRSLLAREPKDADAEAKEAPPLGASLVLDAIH
jgi:hypothetical protein